MTRDSELRALLAEGAVYVRKLRGMLGFHAQHLSGKMESWCERVETVSAEKDYPSTCPACMEVTGDPDCPVQTRPAKEMEDESND